MTLRIKCTPQDKKIEYCDGQSTYLNKGLNKISILFDDTEAFGNNLPSEVVSGFKFNFRFLGQYFDSETNLNYNIHRDYNPVWGRYMSSDPLGLAAGINTYVNGNSLGFSDKLGLFETNNFIRTLVGFGDIGTLGVSYYLRITFNIGDDYYKKENWTNPNRNEIDCFIIRDAKYNSGFSRQIPFLTYNHSYAIAEHYDFSKQITSYLGPLGFIIMTVEIPGYHLSKVGTPFLHGGTTSPPTLLDLQYSIKGVSDGLSIFFSSNNPYIK